MPTQQIHYRLDRGVLVLEAALEDFPELTGAVRAALDDPGASPMMPLLIDMRHEVAGVCYDDIRWHVCTLTLGTRGLLGPRWVILTRPSPVRMAVFSEVEGHEVAMFADEKAAFTWLRGQP